MVLAVFLQASPALAQRRMPVSAPAPAPIALPLVPLPPSSQPIPPAQASSSQAASPAQQTSPGPARLTTGLVTIESDLQRADQLTGVITATGNVRIVYPDQRVVATARQAQYFSKEARVVLSGDVDVVQEDGNQLRAEQVIVLLESERITAVPPAGRQVFSRLRVQPSRPPVASPLAPTPQQQQP